jgi:hypothetical protein
MILAPKLRSRLKRSKKRANLEKIARLIKKKAKGVVTLEVGGTQTVRLLPARSMNVRPKPAEVRKASIPDSRLKKYRRYIGGKKGGSKPPASVNLKSKMTTVKDQKTRGTCVAFASVAAIEHAYGRRGILKGFNLSEQDAFYVMKQEEGKGETHCDDGLVTYRAAEYLSAAGVAKDRHWRYEKEGQLDCSTKDGDDVRPEEAADNADYRIKESQIVLRESDLDEDAGQWINNPRYLESILAAGYPIVVGVKVAGWSDYQKTIDVQLDKDGEPLESDGGHAMLLVGYDRADEYFLFKNSWGAALGDGGYIRLSYDYMRTYGKYGYFIFDVHDVRSNAGECRRDNQCEGGKYCKTGVVGLGAGRCKKQKANKKPCARDGQCRSGRCAWWKTCAKANECRKDKDCKSNQFCSKGFMNFRKNECHGKRGKGKSCSRPKHCESGKCPFPKLKCK